MWLCDLVASSSTCMWPCGFVVVFVVWPCALSDLSVLTVITVRTVLTVLDVFIDLDVLSVLLAIDSIIVLAWISGALRYVPRSSGTSFSTLK